MRSTLVSHFQTSVRSRSLQYFKSLLDECKCWPQLKQIHALLTTTGLTKTDPFAWKILSFAASSASFDIDYAHRFFLHLSNPDLFHYNAVIRGFSNSKTPIKSFHLFVQMLSNGVVPDHLTYPFLFKASAKVSDLDLGGCVHGMVLRNGLVMDLFVVNSMIHMYGSCGEIAFAREVFDEMHVRNLVSWNSMLDGYGKCGDAVSMRKVFDEMHERDIVSWSALIDGYVKVGDYTEALAVFGRMRVRGQKANEVTMISVLCACAHLGALEQGRAMHRYVVEHDLPLTLTLRTSLLDMYAKCGAIKEAISVFRKALRQKTDILIWNTMIGGLATHGYTSDIPELFKEMQDLGIKPDEITYLCLLSACAHGGLVKDAWKYFERLSHDGLEPKSEHYACMVDVLSRAGHLTEAYKFISQMPLEPTASLWGALLNGCINHRKLDIAELVGKRLIELEPGHDGRYIGLSNVYAVRKRWDEARSMREAMELRGVRKFPGVSYVEALGVFHRFIAQDKEHHKKEEIYLTLDVIVEHMRTDVDTDEITCDVN